MKDILIVVSPSKDDTAPVYTEIRTEAQKLGKETQRMLYTTYVLKGPKSFETAMSIFDIARRYRHEVAIFEIESVLFVPHQDQSKGAANL